MLYRARRFGGVGRVSATAQRAAAAAGTTLPLRARAAPAARRALATDATAAAAAASTAAPAAAAAAAPAADPKAAKRADAVAALNEKWNSEWTNRKDIHALLEAATDAPVPTGKYPHLPIRDAVLAKYPFRIQLEATVPMKMMRNKEYQYPHYKAKLSVNVQDMALSSDERRVFLELVGARRSGDKVSFVSREYASVEACEEKVYALLDGCITHARALAAEWRAADASDAALHTLAAVKHTAAEPWDAAHVRGVLLPYEPKRSKISHKRTGLYLWKTGLRPTALGLARAAAATAAAASTSTAVVPHTAVSGVIARPAAAAVTPGSEQAVKQQRRREERKRRGALKAAAKAAAAKAAGPMGQPPAAAAATASTAAV